MPLSIHTIFRLGSNVATTIYNYEAPPSECRCTQMTANFKMMVCLGRGIHSVAGFLVCCMAMLMCNKHPDICADWRLWKRVPSSVSVSMLSVSRVVSSEIAGTKFPEIYSELSRNLLITYVNHLFPSPPLQNDVKYACSWQATLQIFMV